LLSSLDVVDMLTDLDKRCAEENVKADLLLLGGAGLMIALELEGHGFRPTVELDFHIIETTDKSSLARAFEGFDIDTLADIVDFPPIEDLENDALFEIDNNFRAIRISVPSIEMLAISKMFSKREKDLRDLETSELLSLCDAEKLTALIEEYKSYLTNPEDGNLNVNNLKDVKRWEC